MSRARRKRTGVVGVFSEKGAPVAATAVRRTCRIGRRAGCELVIAESRVSRTHAIIEERGGALKLLDEGSHNGTHVNGSRVEDSGLLEPGAIIRIGGSLLMAVEVAQPPGRASAQAKLLCVFEESSVRPIGQDAPVAIDVRLLSATNRPLETMVEQGRFREDLQRRHVSCRRALSSKARDVVRGATSGPFARATRRQRDRRVPGLLRRRNAGPRASGHVCERFPARRRFEVRACENRRVQFDGGGFEGT